GGRGPSRSSRGWWSPTRGTSRSRRSAAPAAGPWWCLPVSGSGGRGGRRLEGRGHVDEQLARLVREGPFGLCDQIALQISLCRCEVPIFVRQHDRAEEA